MNIHIVDSFPKKEGLFPGLRETAKKAMPEVVYRVGPLFSHSWGEQARSTVFSVANNKMFSFKTRLVHLPTDPEGTGFYLYFSKISK